MRKALTIFLGVYALVLILLIPSKGLWVDEIIDLNGVRNASDVNGVLAFVPSNAGGVPLGIWSMAMIRTFGTPSRRFNSLGPVHGGQNRSLCARQTGLRWPMLAWSPRRFALDSRYALRRDLTQAACWASSRRSCFCRWCGRPSARPSIRRTWSQLACIRSPTALFVPAAHLLWLVFAKRNPERSCSRIRVALAAVFLPWFFKTIARGKAR
jgi:hypothetical protein